MKGAHTKRGFTLLELLTVLAVISILLAFVVPNIQGIGASRELANGGGSLVNSINYARQIAMAEKTLTALVLVTEDQPDGGKCARRFIVYAQLADRSTWQPISRWENLAPGVIISGERSEVYFDQQVPLNPPLPPLKYGDTSFQPGSYVYQVFLPNGALLLNANHEPRELGLRLENDSIGKNYFNIIINSNTGIPIILRP